MHLLVRTALLGFFLAISLVGPASPQCLGQPGFCSSGGSITYSGGPTYNVSGPGTVYAYSPSSNFTFTIGVGTFSGTESFTVSDGGAGGYIQSAIVVPIPPALGVGNQFLAGVSTLSVTPAAGTTSFTFTYSPVAFSTVTLTFTNSQQWTDPTPLTIVATTAIAQRIQPLLNGLGVGTHLPFTSGPYGNVTNVLADLAVLGITNIRDWWLGPNVPGDTSNYGTVAAAGIKFDMSTQEFGGFCNTKSILDTGFGLLNTFVGTYPGSINFTEGPNEVNNNPICYQSPYATNAATANGNSTLHFSTTPLSVSSVVAGGYTAMMFVSDLTIPGTQPDPGSAFLASVGTTNAVTVTINETGTFLIAMTAENVGPLTSVADTLGLTWTLRTAITTTAYDGYTFYAEEWTAVGPVGGSYPQTDTITFTTVSNAEQNASVIVMPGVNTSSPFDGSPVTNAKLTGAIGADPLTISTSHANTMIVGNFNLNNGAGCSTAPCSAPIAGVGWTQFANIHYQMVEYQLFNSTQTNLQVTLGDGSTGFGTLGIADALVMLSPSIISPIAANTNIVSTTPTTMLMNSVAQDGGVGNGDSIQFSTVPNTAGAVAWMGDVYSRTKSDASLTGVPVINFTDYPFAGSPGTFDYNNVHFYPTVSVGQPRIQLGTFMAQEYVDTTKPFAITEYSGAEGSGAAATDGPTSARFTINGVFDLWDYGISRIYFYELMDEYLGAGWFMFDYNNVEGAIASAIHNLTTILKDTGGTALTFTPTTLAYSITGLPPNQGGGTWPKPGGLPSGIFDMGGHASLYQKSSGTFELIVWNEPFIWNPNTNAQITPPTSSVTVSLGITAGTVNVYDPITGSSPVTTLHSVNSVSLSLAADPFIVEIVP